MQLIEQMRLMGQESLQAWPGEGGCETVAVEMDGGWCLIVEVDATQQDRRKGKKLQWKEAKLCLAHDAYSKRPACGNAAR